MIEILVLNIKEIMVEDNIELYYKLVPDFGIWKDRIDDIKQSSSKSYKAQKLCATLLLYYMYKKNNIDPKNIYISPQGKLYAKNSIHYSLSHCGNLVCLSYGDKENGIDIEDCKNIKLNDLSKFICESEKEMLRKNPELLLRFWTLKEAYIKEKGMGFSIPLNSFEILFNENKLAYINRINRNIREFHDSDYNIAVISNDNISNEYNVIDLMELKTYLENF